MSNHEYKDGELSIKAVKRDLVLTTRHPTLMLELMKREPRVFCDAWVTVSGKATHDGVGAIRFDYVGDVDFQDIKIHIDLLQDEARQIAERKSQ